MIVVRDVFQARYGKGGELVELFKAARKELSQEYAQRILSDASGPFFTIVTETEVASLAEWEKLIREVFSSPEFAKWFERSLPLIESGRREFYNIE